jgi:ubiquinone/menaquinone biosynthesis C-methylase UbiE
MLTDRQRATLERLGLTDDDARAWASSGRSDDAFDDWLTDRVARRPSGRRARAVYGAEDVHDWARRDVLDALALGPGDHVLDIGCGGGLLLRDALERGVRATGLDHSPEMVELATERASGATVVLGSANRLPFEDGAFTAVSMAVVFFFLDDPVGALREARRVLHAGGRLAVYTTSPELRGTGAAPEPIASLGHFYSEEELLALAAQAGFRDVHVTTKGGGQLLIGRR